MGIAVRKVRRRARADEVVVEQASDHAAIRALLGAAGLDDAGLDRPGTCFLIAYLGSTPIGLVWIETRVDAALIRALWVAEAMRARGVGAALIRAARAAAHTRGARHLFALARQPEALYLGRFGFATISDRDGLESIFKMFSADYPSIHEGNAAEWMPMALDISRDGLILR